MVSRHTQNDGIKMVARDCQSDLKMHDYTRLENDLEGATVQNLEDKALIIDLKGRIGQLNVKNTDFQTKKTLALNQ